MQYKGCMWPRYRILVELIFYNLNNSLKELKINKINENETSR